MYMDAFSKDMLDMGGCLSAAKATATTAAAQKRIQIRQSQLLPPHP